MFTRRALLAPVLGVALASALLPVAATAAPDRQVVLIVVPDRSYEQMLADPFLSDLAAAGGSGLMTTSGGAGEAALTAVNLGAGTAADDAPDGPVPFETSGDGANVDVGPYRAAAGDAEPGMLGSTLSDAGLTVGYLGADRGDVALLAAMDSEGHIPAVALSDPPVETVPLQALESVEASDLVVSPDPALLAPLLEASDSAEVLVVVVGAGASAGMRDRGDTVGPILVAQGSPAELLAGGEEPTGLTSDTTRREGVVSDVDVAPTILEFLGVTVPDEMAGSPIERSGGRPTQLHERYLAHRELVGPVGSTILTLALGSLFAALALVFLFRRPAARIARVIALMMLTSLALFVATIPASALASQSYATVGASLAVAGGSILTVALWRGRGDPRAAVATAAVAGLVLVALDGVLGWPSQFTPLLGGGVFDGERFFGLGNAHAGILLAGAVLGAARLPGRAGVWLIGGAAAFAGLPFLGADLGGSLTLAIAAALWFGLRTWRNLGWRTWALVAAVSLGTVILATLADRVLPGGGTHLSRVSDVGPIGALLDRLAANVRATSANASAWLAVLGLPFWLVLALRRTPRLGSTLEPDPRWRDAVVVLTLAGIAGYLLNDTYGLAGSAFAFASAAMLYPTLVSPRAR